MMLITLEQARQQIRMDQNYDDAYIEASVRAASAAIIVYLKAPSFADSSGLIPTDSAGIALDVPDDIAWACRLLVGEFYRNRDGQQEGEIDGLYGMLPRPVVALLYPHRVPTTSVNSTRRPWWPGCGWDRGCCW
jgi:hypothetical protein